jgi:hypothetical protein
MGEVITIGLDIAKSVFQIHGVDVDGAVVIRKRVSRAKVLEFFAALPCCLVGIEACPSAHHWKPSASGAWPHGAAYVRRLISSLKRSKSVRQSPRPSAQRSAAKASSRSYCPSALRYSMPLLRSSIQPSFVAAAQG